MARPKEQLDPVYGQMTVLSEQDNSKVLVRCSCGTEKLVGRSNLRAGRIMSCGADACRQRNGKARRGPKVGFPRWILPDQILSLWADRQRGVEATALASQYRVSANTVYGLFRRIESLGGIEKYMVAMAALAKQQALDGAPREYHPARQPATVVIRGMVPAPPAAYRPKER